MELPELRVILAKVGLKEVRKLAHAKRYEPNLPRPAPSEMRRISFARHRDDVAKLGEKLLDDPRAKPSDVGEACFDEMLKRATRR
jgi:hypothetical protein